MSEAWLNEAERLASVVAAATSVAPVVASHNDRIVEYRYVPGDAAAAAISLVVSAREVIFTAGVGARVEYGAPGDSLEEVRKLAESVAAGRLSEEVARRRVTFRLEFDDGIAISGTSRFLDDHRGGPKRSVTYRAYGRGMNPPER